MIWYLPPPCLLSATFLAILLRFRSKSCIKPPILAVAAPPKSSNFLIKNLALTSFGDKKQILRKFCNSFLYKKAKLGKKLSLNEKLEPISCTTDSYITVALSNCTTIGLSILISHVFTVTWYKVQVLLATLIIYILFCITRK